MLSFLYMLCEFSSTPLAQALGWRSQSASFTFCVSNSSSSSSGKLLTSHPLAFPPLKTLTPLFMIGTDSTGEQRLTVPLSWSDGELLRRRQPSALTALASRNPCADADAQLAPQQASALLPCYKSEEGRAVSRGRESTSLCSWPLYQVRETGRVPSSSWGV